MHELCLKIDGEVKVASITITPSSQSISHNYNLLLNSMVRPSSLIINSLKDIHVVLGIFAMNSLRNNPNYLST